MSQTEFPFSMDGETSFAALDVACLSLRLHLPCLLQYTGVAAAATSLLAITRSKRKLPIQRHSLTCLARNSFLTDVVKQREYVIAVGFLIGQDHVLGLRLVDVICCGLLFDV